MQTEELQINIGSPQLEWEVDEYPMHQRSKLWYILAAVIGVALIVYAISTANFLFAVIILMVGVITLLSSFVPPDRVPVLITNTGVVVSDMYYDFQAIKDFSIAYDPPHVKNLYFEFHSPWQPLLTVPLEDIDPNEIRDLLLPYCLENLQRVEENLTDVLRRLYKL
ncbi:MAG TPA: hypothetical protein VJB64_03855 [Patescibacteria group bacterium]|nr:hypothetical protein [Patescibacteria group bacterium]